MYIRGVFKDKTDVTFEKQMAKKQYTNCSEVVNKTS